MVSSDLSHDMQECVYMDTMKKVTHLSSPFRTTASASSKLAASRAYGKWCDVTLRHKPYPLTYFSGSSWSSTKYYQQVYDGAYKHYWCFLCPADTCTLLRRSGPQASNQNGQEALAGEQVCVVTASSETVDQTNKTSDGSLHHLQQNKTQRPYGRS